MAPNTKNVPLWFVVFDTRGRAENVSNTKNMPTRACSCCLTQGEWQRMRQTLQTCPCGYVCGVRHKGKAENVPNTENRPLWDVFWCLAHFLGFETRERERGGARAPERACVGSFWCLRQGREREEVHEHQNEPVWARSGGQDGEVHEHQNEPV